MCSYLHSLPDIWKQIVRNIYFPSSYRSLHLDSISQNNELREKDCHQSQSFSVSPRSICQYFPINLVRLKYAIIYAPLRLEVHVIRDKLILEFQNAWMLFSESRKQVRIKNHFMSSFLLNKLAQRFCWTSGLVSACQCLNHHQPKGKYLLMKIEHPGPSLSCLLKNIILICNEIPSFFWFSEPWSCHPSSYFFLNGLM